MMFNKTVQVFNMFLIDTNSFLISNCIVDYAFPEGDLCALS